MYKLSIVIPVYNVEKYLNVCLDSIYSQLTEQCQVILVDDGSTDSSGRLCDEYAEKYDNTVVVHQENAGQGSARNKGVKLAEGEYIFFVDSDDTIEAGAVKSIFDNIERFGSDIIVFPIHSVDENGNLLCVAAEDLPTETVMCADKEKRLVVSSAGPCNKIIKRSLIVDNGIEFPTKVWYEDLRTVPKLMYLADSVVYVEGRFYNYLQRSGSTMNNTKVDRNAEIIDALDDLIAWFKDQGKYDEYRDEIDFLMIDHVLLSATVRVIRSAGRHHLISKFRKYTFENCRSVKSNPYIRHMPKNRLLVLRLILARMYFAVSLIFKIKG